MKRKNTIPQMLDKARIRNISFGLAVSIFYFLFDNLIIDTKIKQIKHPNPYIHLKGITKNELENVLDFL
jgi:hypothetical protein